MQSELNILSLGAGVQSATCYLLSECGVIPPFDAAVFADTQAEPESVYNYISYLQKIGTTPIIKVSQGNLAADIIAAEKRFSSLPFYFIDDYGKQNILRRQCTSDYKVIPVRRAVNKLLKEKALKRRSGIVTMSIGISLEEQNRARFSPVNYIRYDYPLLDLKMTRADCLT